MPRKMSDVEAVARMLAKMDDVEWMADWKEFTSRARAIIRRLERLGWRKVGGRKR